MEIDKQINFSRWVYYSKDMKNSQDTSVLVPQHQSIDRAQLNMIWG